MSVLHVTSASILFISMTTLLVNGDHVMRRSTRRNPNPGRRRSEEPLCRQICANVTVYCEKNCYPPSANQRYITPYPGPVTTRDFVNLNKLLCLRKCIDDDVPIVFKEESCSVPPNMLQPQDEEVTRMPEEAEIDVSALTMADRCHMEAWMNSTVCEFDREYPIVSKKVFDVNKRKLTLCAGSPVVSGRNGFSLKYSFSKEQRQNTATISRKERSIVDELEGPAGTTKKQISGIQQSWQDTDDVCPTSFSYEAPRSAIHVHTNVTVDLYFYGGSSQWFQLGKCESKYPRRNICENFKGHCVEASTAVMAEVMIDPRAFAKTEKLQNCDIVKEAPFWVCREWVLVPTYCKHIIKGGRA